MEQYISKTALVEEIKRLAEVGRNNASSFDEHRNGKNLSSIAPQVWGIEKPLNTSLSLDLKHNYDNNYK